MATKHMTNAEMAATTASWTNPNHDDRRALLAVAAVSGLLPLLDEAHQEILDTQEDEPEAADQTALLERLDFGHDSFVRGTTRVVQGHIELALAHDRLEEAESLERLLERLTPDGLRLVNYSFREEGGQAELLDSRLTAEDRALLASIPVKGGTLLGTVKDWIRTGREIGRVEKARVASRQGETLAGRQLRARNRWIRVVNNVRNVLELAEVDDPRILTMLEQLAQAERDAELRERAATDTPATETTADDNADGTSDTDAAPTTDTNADATPSDDDGDVAVAAQDPAADLG